MSVIPIVDKSEEFKKFDDITGNQIPSHIKTKDGCIQVKVLPWLQYIKYRVSLHGWKYLFKKTSAGYPRFLSLGYYSKSKKEIVVAKVGNWQLRLKHEEGHADGLVHVLIDGDVMHPIGYKRGPFTHICTADKQFDDCNNVVSFENCGNCKLGGTHIKKERIM